MLLATNRVYKSAQYHSLNMESRKSLRVNTLERKAKLLKLIF